MQDCRQHEMTMMKAGISLKTSVCTHNVCMRTHCRRHHKQSDVPPCCNHIQMQTHKCKDAQPHTHTSVHPALPAARYDPLSALPLFSKHTFWVMSCVWLQSANACANQDISHTQAHRNTHAGRAHKGDTNKSNVMCKDS